MNKKHTVDMTKGGIYREIIAFAIPLVLTGILQSLYNAADIVVVGKFTGKTALAAIGSTSSAINLLVCVFVGISSAGGVLVSRKFGAKNESGVSKAVHTSIALSLIGGILLTAAGIAAARPIMEAMDSPENVIDLSVLYMRIYFSGITAMLVYNFGSAILRSVGDTKRPLYFLILSGIINVVLNLVFVIVFKMGVAGVGIATVVSQVVSAALVLGCLISTRECYRLIPKKIKIHLPELGSILYLGIPAGIQSAVFSMSNVLIQSSINSVGEVAMAGNASAGSIEGIVYISMNAFHQAALTFVSQNYGAHNFERIKKGMIASCVTVTMGGLMLGSAVVFFGKELLSLYSDVPDVIATGRIRLMYICLPYFLCGLMEVGVGGLRGIGASIMPMAVTIIGVCGVRIIAVMLGRPYETIQDLDILYISYLVSWFITGVAHFITFGIMFKQKKARVKLNEEQ